MTADVLAVLFSVIALFLASTAWFLLARAMAPRLVGQARARFARTPIRTTILGIVLLVIALIPALVLLGAGLGPLRLAGLWGLGATFAVALTGLGGLAAHVGGSMASPRDAGREWVQVVKGGLVIGLSCLIPILGWFLLLPLVLAAGLGAAVLGVVRPFKDPTPQVVEAPVKLVAGG